MQCKHGYEKEAQALVAALNTLAVKATIEPIPNPAPVGPSAQANCLVILGTSRSRAVRERRRRQRGVRHRLRRHARAHRRRPRRRAPASRRARRARALAERLGLVAVVSGRPVEFLRARTCRSIGVALVGQYGLERLVDGEVVADPRVEPFLDAVAEAARTEADATCPSVLVERKGGIAFTLHWRTAPGLAPHAAAPAPTVAAAPRPRHPTRPHGVRAAAAGSASTRAPRSTRCSPTSGIRVAAFAGDDRGDLAAFDRFDELSIPPDEAVDEPSVW